ncbi:MAG TPA: Ig-like domain-containing protein [Solirubrobacteraceae bacterium]|nr:Ig-like domain-containing protein [Solirubrobacteraceae bacterium]
MLALAAVLAGAATLLGAAPAGAAETGLNVSEGLFGTPAQNAQVQALIAELHPDWVRVFLNWNQVETGPGSYSAQLAGYEQFLHALPAGTKVDIDVYGSPAWANGGSSNPSTPPVNDQVFGAFMNYIANAFGSSVTAYEIWNEEDASSWWTGSAGQYLGLLQAAHGAIKSADPGAQVILGGLTANDYAYLQQLYADGAHGYFDAVAVHTDDACSQTSPDGFAFNPGSTEIERWSFLGFTTVHDVMAANGDGSLPIYMTEFGWSTTSAICSSGVSAGQRRGGVNEKTQALYLEQSYNCLAQPQYGYVAAAMWFDMNDFAPQNNIYDRYGLLSYGLKPKPSFNAFEKVAAGKNPVSGACGNFSGPHLDLISPTNGESYRGALQIRVTATANGSAVSQIAVKHDGRGILNFNRIDAHYAGGVLTGTIDWQGARHLSAGTHTITVVASNANGVTSTETVTVDHLATHHSKRHHGRRHHSRRHR